MTEAPDPAKRSRRRLAALEAALVFVVFFIQGATPVPDVNEPYYLLKAVHYWNPHGIAHDPFLDSADTHDVFYFSIGWLALLLSPAALAWTGRLVTWGLLAWAWRRLSFAVVPRRWLSVLTAAGFVYLIERFAMAGEWVIGGVEAKGFAYVLVFLGLEALAQGRWNRVWPLLGGAAGFHVLVGGWSVVAAAVAWALIGRERPSIRSMAPALVCGFLLSLPGLVPSLALTWGTDPAVVRRANQIYVFYRLGHHLAPGQFPAVYVVRFSMLTILWGLTWAVPAAGPLRRVRAWVAGALVIAVGGLGVAAATASHPALGAALLRFYWFRLSDVAVPLGVALAGPATLAWLAGRLRWRRLGPASVGAPLGILLGLLVLGWAVHFGWRAAFGFRGPVPFEVTLGVVAAVCWAGLAGIGRMPRLAKGAALCRWRLAAACAMLVLVVGPAQHVARLAVSRCTASVPRADRLYGFQAWRAACRWVATSGRIPPHARFLTPPMAETFKWYAERSEVVNWKDVPQDAQSIVAWWDRMIDVHYSGVDRPGRRWQSSFGFLREERLRHLGRKYGADYAISLRWPRRLNLPIVYINRVYVIYRLDGEEPRGSDP